MPSLSITRREFVGKWRYATLKERSTLREHFIVMILFMLTACVSQRTPIPLPPPLEAWPTALPNEPAPGTIRIWPPDSAPMIFIPTGHFLQGARPDDELDSEDERPAHWVQVTGFWIDQLEVTNARYGRCVAAAACRPPMANGSHTREHYFDNPTYADYPVIFVSWYDASAYCMWAGRRLPTEAEWERAARGDDGRRWPWGNEWEGTRANFCDSNCSHRWRDKSTSDGYADTSPAGAFPAGASPFGVLDMAGNVWEWVADEYAPYTAETQFDPSGPPGQELKLLRGGSSDFVLAGLRTTYRYEDGATHRQDTFGFRCATNTWK